MPTLTTHSVTISQKVLAMPSEGTTDSSETLEVSEDFYLVITIKNPIGDPEPTPEDYGESVPLEDTEEITGESDAATIRTTRFWYAYPQDWTAAAPRRYPDAAIQPFPDNIFELQYKDQRDVAQSYTSQIYFTEAA